MAIKKYRFVLQIEDVIKLIAADLPTLPAATNSHGFCYTDISIDESELNYLIYAMKDRGYSGPVSIDSRFGALEYSNATVGMVGSGQWSDNNFHDLPLETDITDPNAINGAVILYSAKMATSKRLQLGRLIVTHDGVSAAGLDHEYSYLSTEISGLSFSTVLAGNALSVRATLAGVGENVEYVWKLFHNIHDLSA